MPHLRIEIQFLLFFWGCSTSEYVKNWTWGKKCQGIILSSSFPLHGPLLSDHFCSKKTIKMLMMVLLHTCRGSPPTGWNEFKIFCCKLNWDIANNQMTKSSHFPEPAGTNLWTRLWKNCSLGKNSEKKSRLVPNTQL